MASLALRAAFFIFFVPSLVVGQTSLNTTAIPLPVPEGPYTSTITVSELTDTSRANPFNGSSPYRQLVVSYYEPYLREDCANIGEIDYMPAAVAEWFNENDLPSPDLTTFSQLKFSDICLKAPTTKPDTPLLIWTGGLYTSRFQYGAIAQAISSWGYRVVTIDHPYDAAAVEFPDGTIICSAYASGAPTDATSAYLQSIRVKDIEFVTGVFSETSEVVGLYGHSLGASSQTAALQADIIGKYVAGCNLDGKLKPPVRPIGLGNSSEIKKSYIFAHANRTIASDPSWTAFWNTTDLLTPNNPRVSLELPKTIHNSFTDLPFVIDVAGVRSVNESYFETLIDTIYGPREIHDITSYVREFFDWTLKGIETHPLLDASKSSFPDVLFVRKAGY
ncbi:hypothetical protein BPAE_0083g00370 [Botrytis paeoniae]|uniref:1-alkyl-2-acetylglycerophosphocholine esterase n=1 Tax=Botrytis paeoniae TaxID=278948 RepID=A0A4Z1FKG9_9HELO|nr:hypothetical protein BPAE_0083g00370 [Botrytis paeoniae]